MSVRLFQLPLDLQQLIYEYDSTYHNIYQKCINNMIYKKCINHLNLLIINCRYITIFENDADNFIQSNGDIFIDDYYYRQFEFDIINF